MNDNTKQEPGAPATGSLFTLLTIMLMLSAACGTTQTFPEPQGSNGQVLVNLLGKPKEGVTGPKTDEERKDYSTSRVSVEKGAAFERVDYDSLGDVVVIMRRNGVEPSGPFTLNGSQVIPELTVDEQGFDHQQLLAVLQTEAGKSVAKVAIRNKTKAEICVFGFNEADGFDVKIPAGKRVEASVATAGVYEVYSEQHEFAVCVFHVTGSDDVWFGSSDEGAFFDQLTPGEYSVTVYPPRLPLWTTTVTVIAGKRQTLDAELTVNVLHKCGH